MNSDSEKLKMIEQFNGDLVRSQMQISELNIENERLRLAMQNSDQQTTLKLIHQIRDLNTFVGKLQNINQQEQAKYSSLRQEFVTLQTQLNHTQLQLRDLLTLLNLPENADRSVNDMIDSIVEVVSNLIKEQLKQSNELQNLQIDFEELQHQNQTLQQQQKQGMSDQDFVAQIQTAFENQSNSYAEEIIKQNGELREMLSAKIAEFGQLQQQIEELNASLKPEKASQRVADKLRETTAQIQEQRFEIEKLRIQLREKENEIAALKTFNHVQPATVSKAVSGQNVGIAAQQQKIIDAQNDKIRQLSKQIQAFRASGKPDDSGVGQYNPVEPGQTPSMQVQILEDQICFAIHDLKQMQTILDPTLVPVTMKTNIEVLSAQLLSALQQMKSVAPPDVGLKQFVLGSQGTKSVVLQQSSNNNGTVTLLKQQIRNQEELQRIQMQKTKSVQDENNQLATQIKQQNDQNQRIQDLANSLNPNSNTNIPVLSESSSSTKQNQDESHIVGEQQQPTDNSMFKSVEAEGLPEYSP